MTTILSIPMNEGIDVHLQTSSQDPLVNVSPAVVRSRGALPLAHGMEPGEESWSFEQVEDRLYSVNGRSRMQAYDGDAVTRASLAPPVGNLSVKAERIAIRVQDQGWVSCFKANVNLTGANLRLTNIAPVNPATWRPSKAMEGKLIVIPSNRYFGAGGADGPDIIGRVVVVTSETQIDIETDGPAFIASQETGEVLVRCFYYDAEELSDLDQSTPYTVRRPAPHGGDEETDAVDQDGQPNVQALEFHGSHALKIDQELTEPIGPDTVFDFKCYLKPTSLATGFDQRQIIFQRRGDEKSAALELSIVENGKVEFRFWDRSLEDFRSIRTVGVCFTEGHWHYFRFRYKFKRGGMKAVDSVGGWETDHRWIHRSTDGKDFDNQYRDGLWVWDLESAGHTLDALGQVIDTEPNEPFLVVTGCHNGFNLDHSVGTNAWVNRSREPGNVGLVKENPWIGPEETDARYSWGALPGTPNIVAYQASIAAGVAGTDANIEHASQMITALWLPRWFGLNRDSSVTDDPYDSHINQAQAQSYHHGIGVPAASSTLGNGVLRQRAVLCYVFGTAAGVPLSPVRILAVKDLHGTGGTSTELGIVDRDSAPNSEFILTDDPRLGADNGGALPLGDYVIAFCLPNGSNHSGAATGNTTPIPTLLEHGEHPVGVNDDPDPEDAPFYLGGSPNQEDEAHAINGLFAVLDDVAFSFHEVTGDTVYTPDHMMPDTKFNGPVDTRVHSLPKLTIGAETSTNGEDIAGETVIPPFWSSDLEANTSGPNIVAIQGTATAELKQLDTKVQSKGKHLVVATFYDPERNVESPPSQVAQVEIAAENDPDQTPVEDERYDAAYKIRIEALPISADTRRHIWRRVYKTLADGSAFLLAAEVRDNRSGTLDLNPTDTFLGLQEQVDMGYLEPPICSIIRADERRMFFAGIKDAIRENLGNDFVETPRLVAWSDEFRPWQVPGTNREILESGRGGKVNGLAYLTGRMFALYPDALFVADDLATAIRWRRVQANVGTLSHFGLAELEDYIALPGEKGVYALDASSRMLYVSPPIEETWRGLHSPAMKFAKGVYNRQRNQYQLAVREQLSGEYQLLLTGEASDSPFAGAQDGLATAPGALRPLWSKQIHPVGLEALHASEDPFTDRRVVLLGSGMGFAMLMDVDSGVRGHEIGTMYGDIEADIDSEINPGVWQLKNFTAFDTEHDGLAGVPWVLVRPNADNPNLETYLGQGVVFSLTDSGVLRVLRRQAVPTAQEDDKVYLGGWVRAWRSKWFGVDAMARRERVLGIRMLFERVVGGWLTIEWFQDFDESNAVETIAHPMDRGYAWIRADLRGRYIQFRISRVGTSRPLNIFAMSLAFEVASQRD